MKLDDKTFFDFMRKLKAGRNFIDPMQHQVSPFIFDGCAREINRPLLVIFEHMRSMMMRDIRARMRED